MSRPDLLALTPEGLAALANLGLVKRAQRALAAGLGPALEEDPDGAVTGRFDDGTVTRLVPGKRLRDTPCSCPAAPCWHRVVVALAYPPWHAAHAGPGAPVPTAGPALRWSPSCFTDADLAGALGKRAMERALALVRAGVVVEIEPGEVPSARLPSCTVRFHVPRDLAYARCDCVAGAGCEHVVVAAWAFREAERVPGAETRTVELHMGRERASLDVSAMDGVMDLARMVLAEGVSSLAEGAAPRFARVRRGLAAAGFVWPSALVDDLEKAVDAYRAQSARYSATEAAAVLTGIGARARAALRGGELPARYVLGADEARETLLDHVRLVSLGARVTASGRARDVEVFVSDPASGVVLVLGRRWTYRDGETPEDGPALALRGVLGKVTLGALARGQIVSRRATRRANRSIAIDATRAGDSSVTPQIGAWNLFPPSILAPDFAALRRSMAAAPPALLRPLVLAEAMRIVPVARVGRVHYRPGEQDLLAEVIDARGGAMILARRYRRAAPHALSAIAAALSGPSPIRFVAGDVRHGPFGLAIDPVGIVTDRVIVPDLEGPEGPGAAVEVREDAGPSPVFAKESPILAAIDVAAGRLEEAAHLGLIHVGAAWIGRAREAAQRLDEVGLGSLARRVSALASRVEAVGDARAPERVREAADAWMRASIRVSLARESASAAFSPDGGGETRGRWLHLRDGPDQAQERGARPLVGG